jgi:hypothetical protein
MSLKDHYLSFSKKKKKKTEAIFVNNNRFTNAVPAILGGT